MTNTLDQIPQSDNELSLDELSYATSKYLESLDAAGGTSKARVRESVESVVSILKQVDGVESTYFLPANQERIYTVIIATVNGRAVAFAIFDEKGFAMNGGRNAANSTSESFRGLFLGSKFDGTPVPDSITQLTGVDINSVFVVAMIPKHSNIVGSVLKSQERISGGVSTMSIATDMSYMKSFPGQIALIQEHAVVKPLLFIAGLRNINIISLGGFTQEGNISDHEKVLAYVQSGPDSLNY